MAAGGFKTFTTGEVLTAADTNNFLMQGVLVFDDAAARDAAITAPVEGQVVYLKDTNAILSYDGTSYVGVGGSSPLTTKGDLYTFSTVDARLGVGANDTVLTADSSEATGLKWAAAAAGGKVLQVVSMTDSTNVESSTTSYVDTNLTLNITPSSATSKILVFVNMQGVNKSSGNSNNAVQFKILRGATSIGIADYIGFTSTALALNVGSWNSTILDSPNTTSATTYKVQFSNIYAASNAAVNFGSSPTSSLTLLEIGA